MVFGFFYVWFCIPEVKGLSLEEVDELYRANIKPWKSTNWKPAAREARHIGGKRVVHGEIVDDDDSSEPDKEQEKAAVQDERRIENA